MKKSINVIPEGQISEIVDLAVAAESKDFDRCWVYDEGLATRDVYVTLAAVSAATNRLEIGPGITNPYTRHPAQTVAAIATLDELSDGRAFLGIGAGGSLTLDPLGLRLNQPLRAVRDTIEIARRLFRGEDVDYDGPTFQLRSASIDYPRSGIEIWLAGRGPKMLALGGELADGVMLDFIHKSYIDDYVNLVGSAGPAALCYSTAVVTTDEDLESVRPHMTYRLVDSPEPVKEAIGLLPAESDRIRQALSGGLHAAAEHVRDEWIDPFVISGSVSECKAELAELTERHGFSEFLVPMFDMPDPLGYLERLRTVLQEH